MSIDSTTWVKCRHCREKMLKKIGKMTLIDKLVHDPDAIGFFESGDLDELIRHILIEVGIDPEREGK